MVTSPLVKPVTVSLKTTVKTMKELFVGSSWVAPSLIVTVGEVRSIVSSFVVVSVAAFPAWSVAVAATSYVASARAFVIAAVHVFPETDAV